MGTICRVERNPLMATRWRRRCLCLLVTDSPVPARLRDVSARGAFLETHARPALGSQVELRHPEAGTIFGRVRSAATDGVAIDFDPGAEAMAFALAAIAADMTAPG